MATLRDNGWITGAARPTVTQRDLDDLEASGMNEFTRNWRQGRLTTEINPLRNAALDARIAGDVGRERTLRDQIGQLEQRQQAFAPSVKRIEDIDGIGKFGTWAAGAVGSGLASMVDPIAVAAGLSGAGRIASAIPHPIARGVGKLAQIASGAVPVGMGVEQLRGEFTGEAERDPELMARTSPEQLRDMSYKYGIPAALLDSALPILAGRQLVGSGLRKGISALGPGTRTGLTMLGESGTETLQDAGSKYAQGVLNPNRDTSGDASSFWNSAAGGFVGAGPVAAAGAYADAGYRRIGDTTQKLGTAAGDVVDMFNQNETVQNAKAAGGKFFGRAKDAVVDLQDVTVEGVKEKLKSVGEDLMAPGQRALDEHSVLNDQPPDDIVADTVKATQWMNENAPRRAQLVADKLREMGDDPEAQAHLAALQSGDPAAFEKAAQFVSESTPLGRATSRGQALAQMASKAASVAGPAIGKGAVAVGKAALDFGKGVVSGAKEGLAKKNLQSDTPAAPESFGAWRDRIYGVQGEAAAKQVLDEAAAEFAPRAELAGNYAADMGRRVKSRDPNLPLLARNAAFLLADVVMITNAKGLGQQNVKLNRLVDDLHDAFRAETPEVLAQLSSIMGPKAAPVMEYMSQELEARMLPPGFKEHVRQREELAQQVVGLVDSTAQSKLITEDGINLSLPAGREKLLGMMEDYADGVGKTPGMRKAYEGVFGADSIGRIMELLNGVAEPETRVGSVIPEPIDAQEKRDAEKNFVKGVGNKVYGFHATKNLRFDSERADAFGLTKKTADGDIATRPNLFIKGQQLSPEHIAAQTKGMTINERVEWKKNPKNTSAVAKKIADMEDELGVGRTPEHMAKLMDEEARMMEKEGDTKAAQSITKTAQAVRRRIAAIEPDSGATDAQRAKAQTDLDDALETFFLNRAGSYDVRERAVLDVMRDANMQPTKILQLHRDYLLMDGNTEGSAKVNALLMKIVRITKRTDREDPAGLLSRNKLAAAWMDANPNKPIEEYADMLVAEKLAALKVPLAAASKDAEDYFGAYTIVVGEQPSDRDPGKIDITEVMEMNKAGQGLIERSRGGNTDGVFKAFSAKESDEKLSDANIIMFRSAKGELAIPAGKLVKWVKQQRGKAEKDVGNNDEDFSNRSKDDAYLADVMEGIAILIGSGRVQGMPYKVNKFGDRESFSAGVPDSLRLATMTYGDMKFGEKSRRGPGEPRRTPVMGPPDPAAQVDARYEEMDDAGGDPQLDVAADQDRNAEFFTADDRALRDLVVDDVAGTRSKRRSGKDDTRAAASAEDAGGELVTREAGRGTSTKMRVDVSGQVTPDPKTDETDMTPLDFSKEPKDGVPDEYANQRWLSRQTGATTDSSPGPEPKGTAASSAEFRAGKINEAFLSDPAKGQEMIRSRIRMALRPAYTENRPAYDKEAGQFKLTVPGVAGKDQVVGGVHYIAPVAAFVGPKNLAKNNVDLSAGTINAIQVKVANILLKGDISKTEQVKIARLMLDDVTSFNVLAKLQGVAAPSESARYDEAMKLPDQAPPAPGVVEADGVDATNSKGKPLSIEARTDALILKGMSPSNATKLIKLVDEMKAIAESMVGRKEKGPRADWAKTQKRGRFNELNEQKQAIWKATREKNAVEAAPGVANAGLPKGQPTPFGKANPFVLDSRIRDIAEDLAGSTSPDAVEVTALSRAATNRATSMVHSSRASYSEILAHPLITRNITKLISLRLLGNPYAAKALDKFFMALDQLQSLVGDDKLNLATTKRLVVGGKLSDYMGDIAASNLPLVFREIAQAVGLVAGNTPVSRVGRGIISGDGEFRTVDGTIRIKMPTFAGESSVATVLHEGVHAATFKALTTNPELQKAAYALMDHVGEHDKQLLSAYGLTNTTEFLAEGLSNEGLLARLKKIPPNAAVAKYLGATVANAWEAFVGLVRKALGLTPEHDSALMQLMELGGRAMLDTHYKGVKSTNSELFAAANVRVVPLRYFTKTIESLKAIPEMNQEARAFLDGEMRRESNSSEVSHITALLAETVLLMTQKLVQKARGEGQPALVMDGATMRGLFDAVHSSLRSLPAAAPSKVGGDRKLNAMAVDIHRDLGRSGFAATHDSPIRHAGVFDWQNNLGRGEGHAAFGAGTNLSTADGVHKSYKNDFTAVVNGDKGKGPNINDRIKYTKKRIAESTEVGDTEAVQDYTRRLAVLEAREAAMEKSPTYEVSVNIKQEELMDWDAPLNKQSALVQRTLESIKEHLDNQEDYPLQSGFELHSFDGAPSEAVRGTGEDTYRGITQLLGSQTKASLFLMSYGILGHTYNAVGGRNVTHRNYIIYDDSKITTNYVHFNTQYTQDAREGNAKIATQADMDAAIAYATKVLGPKIKVEFKNITGYSGEFIDAKNVIEISTTAAAGTMNTLFHEAMHVFFRDFVKGNPRLQGIFESLVNDPKHLAKLQALLKDYPAALAQLSSGEERLAYTYQFWKAGLLSVDAKAHTWMQKVGKFFRRVLGMVRESERALELFQAFDQGKMSEPSAAGKVIAEALGKGANALKVYRQLDGLTQGLAKLVFPAGEIFETSVSPTARKLGPMLSTNPGDETHGDKGEGMVSAQRQVAKKYSNNAQHLFEDMTEVDQLAVQKYLQNGTLPGDVPIAEHRAAVKAVRDTLERFHEYMTDSGMKIGKVENYYPVVWSAGALLDKKAAFIAMITQDKYVEHLGKDPELAAERIWQSLVDKEGVDAHLPAGRSDGVLAPFFASQENRTLPWLESADREEFLDKNLVNTLTRYFHQGARAAEYFRRFGENGEKLDAMLKQIGTELEFASKEKVKRGEIDSEKARVKWVSRQMRDISQATGAMEGTLGKDMSPNMRKFNSWMVVYQNIRLLPTSLFSSFVDPLSITGRGAPLQAAFESFMYGMKEVFGAWGDSFRDMPADRQKDEWRDLAEHVGVTEVAMFSHHMSDQYSSMYMTSGAKHLNDKMFRFNGMEAWNRGMRIMATKWGVRFIEQHAGLIDKNHSARWLTEIGLTPDMITLDDGKLVTNRHALAKLKGITIEQATLEMEPIHRAIGRWVDGAVITPGPGSRPAWMSDPNFTTFGHLKQFSYSFHQTMLKRAVSEFKHGNIAPMGALFMFIPTMITADLMKGLIVGGGSLPPYMAGWNAGDHLLYGIDRAGLAGIGVIGVDASADISSLGGPAVEQVVDAMRDGFGSKTAVNALPLHALYANALR